MLTYLLIAVVIVLALAPLAQILPSKRQRRLARMREYAALHGLFVEFRHVPSLPGQPRVDEQVIYYGRRLSATRATPIASAAWVKTGAGWQCVGGRLPPPQAIAQLNTEIRAASIDQASCGVYWTESAEEASVEEIRLALERWSQLPDR